MDYDKLMRLIATVRTLQAFGRSDDKIKEDLKQSHGLTDRDLKQLFSLV